MRLRPLILLFFAILLAGGTAMLARAWLAAQRTTVTAEASPIAVPAPTKSVLIARVALQRGQILKADDLVWQPWPDGGLDKAYVVMGSRTPESFAGSVARYPLAPGEPITEPKLVAPGNRGFLAAVLRPGMRAVSVPVTVTTGISGFIFPGDSIDILITHALPNKTGGAMGYEHKVAETVLHDVRVIAIDQRLDARAGEAVVAHTATLEVTPKQSEIVALASEIGKLSLSLRSLVRNPLETPPSDESAPTDSQGGAVAATFTLDSEVSPILGKPLLNKDNPDSNGVTILRGSSKGGDSSASQPGSRGS